MRSSRGGIGSGANAPRTTAPRSPRPASRPAVCAVHDPSCPGPEHGETQGLQPLGRRKRHRHSGVARARRTRRAGRGGKDVRGRGVGEVVDDVRRSCRPARPPSPGSRRFAPAITGLQRGLDGAAREQAPRRPPSHRWAWRKSWTICSRHGGPSLTTSADRWAACLRRRITPVRRPAWNRSLGYARSRPRYARWRSAERTSEHAGNGPVETA